MIKKYISPLQYITQGKSIEDIEQEVRAVLNGGCDWIQLRMKEATEKEFIAVAKRIREHCYSYNATFIVNDNPIVAMECKADGVHLGKGDMPTSTLRELIGNKLIVGRTANSVRDIELLSKQRIDYIGLGPYKFTTTKENISNTLGEEGYFNLFKELKNMGITPPPVVAIGGITFEDIAKLSAVEGVNGIAVSGVLFKAQDIAKSTREFVTEVERCFNIKNYNLK